MTRRGRRIAALSVLVVLLGVVAAAVVVIAGRLGAPPGFRAESEAVFAQLRDGRSAELYRDAAPRFRQTLLAEAFEDLVARMDATLGRYRRLEVTAAERAPSGAGETARVHLLLQFERATTRGQLAFLRGDDGRWRLLGLDVEIPPDLVARATDLEAQETRTSAPAEVIALVTAMLLAIRDGKALEVHAQASPSFRESIPADRFAALVAGHRQELGDFVAVRTIVSSAQNAARDRARVQTLLEFARARTTGTFEFTRADGTWRLLAYKVVVPQPLLPD